MGANGKETQLPAIANRTESDSYGYESMTLDGLLNLWRVEMLDKPGECSCPVIDGIRGFRKKCEVHGGRDRSDFARLTALRVEIASRLTAPASARSWGKSS